MREILFRGERVDNGEWIEGCIIFEKRPAYGDVFPLIKPVHAVGFEVDPQTIGQYTGLKDKNGTKIFEGDVVCVVSTNEIKEIIYHKCSFGVPLGDNIFAPIYWHEDLEIIGNIHDNPELIKEQNA